MVSWRLSSASRSHESNSGRESSRDDNGATAPSDQSEALATVADPPTQPAATDAAHSDGGSRSGEYAPAVDVTVPRLPRQQRAFLGRVARAMMEGIQVIGKTT